MLKDTETVAQMEINGAGTELLRIIRPRSDPDSTGRDGFFDVPIREKHELDYYTKLVL